MNDINQQVSLLRLEISGLESEIIQYVTQYGREHDLVKEMNVKLVSLKENLDRNIQKLIGKGYQSTDPLAERQKKITELLVLESEIVNQKLKIDEYNKLEMIYNEKLSKITKQKQLEFSRLLRDKLKFMNLIILS